MDTVFQEQIWEKWINSRKGLLIQLTKTDTEYVTKSDTGTEKRCGYGSERDADMALSVMRKPYCYKSYNLNINNFIEIIIFYSNFSGCYT